MLILHKYLSGELECSWNEMIELLIQEFEMEIISEVYKLLEEGDSEWF